MTDPNPSAPSGPSPAPHPSIVGIPAFSDNYIWLLRDVAGRRAAVVDPGDAAPVLAALAERGLSLAAVLLTHHHPDHVGGLPALRAAFPEARTIGPAAGTIAGLDREVRAGDVVELDGFDARFEVIEVPGHTLDHIAFRAARIGPTDPRPVLFCGDTLFAAGCGRLFEGTALQMHGSLARLARGPDETLVYCAHEYTASNLRFARAVEPDSPALAERDAETARRRAAGLATVPSSLGAERATNPFLRTAQPAVRRAAEARLGRAPADEVEVLAAIREWKDRFR
ncbi:MAG TPA: hydroxyacylglutathione hydrolase [Burkholderiaceae bacterium]|nr:hydroxyacylglutathione hydrolase [Burkholderiaceae bacterium]